MSVWTTALRGITKYVQTQTVLMYVSVRKALIVNRVRTIRCYARVKSFTIAVIKLMVMVINAKMADIDECTGNGNKGNCSQFCNNTNGSFYCYCESGYDLDADGLTCHGILALSNS